MASFDAIRAKLEELHAANAINADELAAALKRARDALGEVNPFVEELKDAVHVLGDSLESNLVSVLKGAKSLDDALKDIANTFIDVAREVLVINPIRREFGDLLSGLRDSVFGGLLDSVFGGGKAHGGPVVTNKAYLVGEDGPEMFVPPAAGRIVANSRFAVGGAIAIVG